MLYRYAESKLENWYCQRERKNIKPLMIRGARQVGKSTLVREFCRKKKLQLIEINLERHQELAPYFKKFDISGLLSEFEAISNLQTNNPDSLIFLDEIQSVPEAIPCLRYFLEDRPGLPVVSAGSLLEFVLEDHEFEMPVGRVEYLHLGPMTYGEFLLAMNEQPLADGAGKFSTNLHEKRLARFREFLFVGGMPEAVASFVETKSQIEARNVQNRIILNYLDDFPKYAGHAHIQRIRKVFNHVPFHLGQKVKFSNISPDDQARDIKQAIHLLVLSQTLVPVVHSSASGLPLSSFAGEKHFKLYFLDVGLANAMARVHWETLDYKAGENMFFERAGSCAEQFVAQHLLNIERNSGLFSNLYYWMRESKSSNAELDFLIERQNEIIPVEVKAGKSGKMRSLAQFISEKAPKHAIRLDLNPASKIKLGDTILNSSPLYEAELVLSLV